MRTWRVLTAAVALVAAASAACGDDDGDASAAAGQGDQSAGAPTGDPPTDEEVRALLDESIAMVEDGRADDLCDLAASPHCGDELEEHLEDAPTERPEVVASVASDGGKGFHPARMITVCGVDGSGRPYETDLIAVLESDGTTRFGIPVYWSGLGGRLPAEDPTTLEFDGGVMFRVGGDSHSHC